MPVAHGLGSGLWPWRSAASGYWAPFWIDGMALAMAFAFAFVAHAAAKRARAGEPNSVWAEPAATG